MLHLHDPEHCRDITEITSHHGSLAELFKMKEEGLAETVGLAMGKTDLMLEIIKDWPFDAIINHNRFTILNRNADELYKYAFKNNIIWSGKFLTSFSIPSTLNLYPESFSKLYKIILAFGTDSTILE